MKYDGNNLKEVLEAHNRWLRESKTWLLSEDKADLRGAYLSGVNLSGVNLSGADLSEAYLSGADLSEAYLSKANLSGADLRGTKLSEAYLSGADLSGADLRGAYLSKANLRGACLSEAYMIGACLRMADLSGADLKRTCLSDTYLSEVYMERIKSVPFIPLACPDTGAFVAWKTCASENGRVIVKLLIPEDARRSSATDRKCRADKAIVLEIQTIDGDALERAIAWSTYNKDFTYEVGKTVTPKQPFCEDRFDQCASGIHFFINRQDAVEYY